MRYRRLLATQAADLCKVVDGEAKEGLRGTAAILLLQDRQRSQHGRCPQLLENHARARELAEILRNDAAAGFHRDEIEQRYQRLELVGDIHLGTRIQKQLLEAMKDIEVEAAREQDERLPR